MIIVSGHRAQWGLIPLFLDEHDPRPAKEQINELYVGGWKHFRRLSFDPVTRAITYPNDELLVPVSEASFRDETLLLYDAAWVVILQTDGSWEVCRLD